MKDITKISLLVIGLACAGAVCSSINSTPSPEQKEQASRPEESAFEIGYKVGLDICNSLSSNQISAFELGRRVSKRQKQYAHAGEEAWDSDFGSGVGQALLDKNVEVTLDPNK